MNTYRNTELVPGFNERSSDQVKALKKHYRDAYTRNPRALPEDDSMLPPFIVSLRQGVSDLIEDRKYFVPTNKERTSYERAEQSDVMAEGTLERQIAQWKETAFQVVLRVVVDMHSDLRQKSRVQPT